MLMIRQCWLVVFWVVERHTQQAIGLVIISHFPLRAETTTEAVWSDNTYRSNSLVANKLLTNFLTHDPAMTKT